VVTSGTYMKKKRLLIVAAVLALILIVLIVAVPFLIDVDRFRPAIQSQLESALGRPVEIGHLQFSLITGGVKAQAITIGDDESFSQAPFLRAETLSAGVDIWPLLRSREMHIHSLTIERPQINLIRTSNGRWNFSTLGAPRRTSGGDDPPASSPSQPSEFSIERLDVTGGKITLSRAGGGTQQTLDDVSIHVENIAPGATVPMQISAKTPSGGSAKIAGTFGPLDPKGSLERAQIHLKLDGQKLPAQDLEGVMQILGVGPPSGSKVRGGTVNMSLAFDGPFDRLVTTGQISVSDARLAGFDLASKLGPLMALSGISSGSETRIQSMSGRIHMAPEGMRADDLVIAVPPLGTLTGTGTVSPDTRLNFHMIAKLSAQTAAGPFGALGQMIGMQPGTSGSIPFRIQGTTANPVFVPELGKVGKQAGKIPATPNQNLDNILGGFQQRRKP
jgi:hypothetical protein